MPDAPRPNRTIAFPAFQTPGGLLPQSAREHQSDYAEAQGSMQALARRTDGVWLDLPYSPGRYTSTPPGSIWQVTKPDIFTARYKVVGAELQLHLYVFGSVVGAESGALQVELPERLRARQLAFTTAFVASNAIYAFNTCQIVAGSRILQFFFKDFTAWPIGFVRIGTQITIEVEEV